ncbi:unnamed protein product [[Candida] boidinii]|nr:unnamed protein product [[Candida] boidinii]
MHLGFEAARKHDVSKEQLRVKVGLRVLRGVAGAAAAAGTELLAAKRCSAVEDPPGRTDAPSIMKMVHRGASHLLPAALEAY